MKQRALAELIHLQSGFAFKSKEYTDNGHFLVRIGNVQDGYLSLDNPKYVTLNGKTARFALDEGDFLTSLTGDIGRVARIEKSNLPAALNQRVARIKVRDHAALSADYLFYFMSSDLFREELNEGGHGVAQQNVSPSDINALTIPLPSLPEQRRIVGILDEAFAGIATAKANAKRNLQNARALFESHLNAVFTQRGEGWVETTLEVVCHQITDGKHGDCQNEGGSGFFFLSAKDVKGGTLNYESARQITEADFAETHRRTNLEPGDILITNSGTIGRMAIAPTNDQTRRTTFQKSVAILKPIKTELDSKFAFYCLSSGLIRFVDLSAGTAQKNLLLRDLRSYRFAMPNSLDSQRSVAKKLDDLSNETDRLESIYRRKLAALDQLKKSLLHQAFSGEL